MGSGTRVPAAEGENEPGKPHGREERNRSVRGRIDETLVEARSPRNQRHETGRKSFASQPRGWPLSRPVRPCDFVLLSTLTARSAAPYYGTPQAPRSGRCCGSWRSCGRGMVRAASARERRSKAQIEGKRRPGKARDNRRRAGLARDHAVAVEHPADVLLRPVPAEAQECVT